MALNPSVTRLKTPMTSVITVIFDPMLLIFFFRFFWNP